MVSETREVPASPSEVEPLHILSFEIAGGIFGAGHNIRFPTPPLSGSEPGILVLSGRNGSGKTTILRMISEIVERLNFDTFRRVPFKHATLALSNGDTLVVEKREDEKLPLTVTFGELKTHLPKDRNSPPPEIITTIDAFRAVALPILNRINFQLVDIHRSSALRKIDQLANPREQAEFEIRTGFRSGSAPEPTLSNRVRNFMREAQINYRQFFAADELELLPRIVNRFSSGAKAPPTISNLASRVAAVQRRFSVMQRFGLQTDDADLKTLADLLGDRVHMDDAHALTLVEAYVEMQENRHNARELIATRLLEFESIMDEFLLGKSIRIDAKTGLKILADGQILHETELSSGEYHFLYMMVSALLCQRSGTILAIDEPELSLHVTWQRKVINALARCAAGASPVFLFATHSPAVAAEYANREYALSPLD